MIGRVTQTDVARLAGVHSTTVSLALRNSPLIRPATRQRVQEVARMLGYAPDPALQALASYRQARRHPRRETLVYLDGTDSPARPDLPGPADFRAAVERRAIELGFAFRAIPAGPAGIPGRRLDRMLQHERIRCVIVGPGADRAATSELDWTRLCAIRLGEMNDGHPALHHVGLDAGAIVRTADQQVRRLGYRRPGLVIGGRLDPVEEENWAATFIAEQFRIGARYPLPVLRSSLAPGVAHWHRQYRPDVVLGLGASVPELLARAGLRVPEDVAFADLQLQDAFAVFAGMRPHCERLGAIAVDAIAAQLSANQFGLPAVPTCTTAAGAWQDGASLPAKAPPARELTELPSATLSGNLVA